MIDRPLVYPFYEEAHLRRGRSVQRPVVLVSIGDPQLTFEALVDSGSEHVLADSMLAIAAGIDLSDPIDVEEDRAWRRHRGGSLHAGDRVPPPAGGYRL